ncbi:MAG: hypothetical protein PHS79_03195 [Patescibacteria group bacterium]|nr:hypothetical protein [Patescibacteria group bacterium]
MLIYLISTTFFVTSPIKKIRPSGLGSRSIGWRRRSRKGELKDFGDGDDERDGEDEVGCDPTGFHVHSLLGGLHKRIAELFVIVHSFGKNDRTHKKITRLNSGVQAG